MPKGGGNFGDEPRHLVLDLRVRLQADIEVEDDLVEAGGLDLFQGLVSVLCAGEPSNTDFSVRSWGRTFRNRSTIPMK